MVQLLLRLYDRKCDFKSPVVTMLFSYSIPPSVYEDT